MSESGKRKDASGGGVSEKTCLVMKNELSFFPFLEEEDLADMPCYFEPKEIREGEVLCREGDPCDFVAFIVSGRLEIKKETEFKGKEFVLGIYSAGSMVGELCIIDDHPRPYTAVALEDCSLIRMSKGNFEKMLEEEPGLGVKFLRGLLLASSIRLRKSFDRMAAIF